MDIRYTKEECLRLAMMLGRDCGLTEETIDSLSILTPQFYYPLFSAVFNVKFGVEITLDSANQVQAFRALIRLAEYMLNMGLEHITADDLAAKRIRSHFHLLEILAFYRQKFPNRRQLTVTKSPVNTNHSHRTIPKRISSLSFSSSSSKSGDEVDHSMSASSMCSCSGSPQANRSSTKTDLGSQNKQKPVGIPQTRKVDPTQPIPIPKMTNESSAPVKSRLRTTQSKVDVPLKNEVSKEQVNKESKSKLLHQLSNLTEENFSLEIGRKIYEALKLRDKTKQIMKRVEGWEKRAQSTSPRQVSRKRLMRPRRTFGTNRIPKSKPLLRKPNKTKVVPKPIEVDQLLSQFPDVPPEMVSLMHKHEEQQRLFIRNTLNDRKMQSSKGTKLIKEAIDKQVKRSDEIHNDLRHLTELEKQKAEKAKSLSEQSAKRELRTERARLYNLVKEVHRDILSKYKSALSKEEALLRDNFREQLTRRKQDLLDLSKQIREEENNEMQRQRLLLDSFDNLYKNNLDILRESITKEEDQLKKRLLHQTSSLKKLQREFKDKLNKQVKTVTSKL